MKHKQLIAATAKREAAENKLTAVKSEWRDALAAFGAAKAAANVDRYGRSEALARGGPRVFGRHDSAADLFRISGSRSRSFA